MKRASFILLFVVYSLSALGIGVERFYCCGKLKEVSIRFGQLPAEDCEAKGGMKDCCIANFVGMDVEDGFVPSAIVLPSKQSINLHLLVSSPIALTPPPGLQENDLYAVDLPPGTPRSDLYLQYRVLLI